MPVPSTSMPFALLIWYMSFSCASVRVLKVSSTDNINNTLPDCWISCKQCGSAAVDWAQAGELWKIVGKQIAKLEPSTRSSPCSAPGFKIHEHGDRKNPVAYTGDKKFLYVSGSVEGSTGAGATICDVGKSNGLQYVYTNGLNGCMGLGIVGTHRESGTKDVFFAHLRKWSDYGGVTKKSISDGRNVAVAENDPLQAAQEFVHSHENLNIFFGSGVHDVGKNGHYTIGSESFILSQILGVTVMNDWYHSKPFARTLGLDIKLEALVTLSGKEERVRTFLLDEGQNADVFKSYKPQPDRNLLKDLAMLWQKDGSDNILDCVFALRAFAAGDYGMIKSLMSKVDNYGYHFKRLLEKVNNEMKEKGYESRLRNMSWTSAPTHMLLIPGEP